MTEGDTRNAPQEDREALQSLSGGDITNDSGPAPQKGMTWQECRNLAAKFAVAGIPSFPIGLKWSHDKGKVDKRPTTPNGHHDATVDRDKLEEIFGRHIRLKSGEWPGVGVYPGPANLLVLDVDDLAALDRLETDRGQIPGRRIRTASGGLHIYMRLPDAVTIGQRSPWQGIDIRSSKGWAVAPGVSTPWGSWTVESGQWDDAPQWVIDDLAAYELTVTTTASAPLTETGGEPITEGGRNLALFREARSMNRRGWTLPETVEALAIFNERHCDPPHVRAEVERAARAAFERYEQGRPPDEGDHDHTDALARAVRLVRAADLTPENVEFFEDGLIPLRVVTLMTGVDGVGKSTILYTKAARATRGTLPGVFHGTPVDVVIASVEDHPQSVILPRLIAAGADLERVHIVKVDVDGLEGEISLPDDLPAVASRVRDVGARLLIIDPLVAYMPMQIDSHKAQHIRSVLAPLARLAEDEHLAVGAVVHFNGSPSTDVRTRISGSKALRDAARSVLVCGEDPDDETRFLLIQDKNSFGPKPSTGTAYRIEGTVVESHGDTFTTSKVAWLGEVQITSRQMLAGSSDKGDATERDIARDVILAALGEQPRRWADLAEMVADEGASEHTGRRARDTLKRDGLIETFKTDLGWFWRVQINLPTPPGQSEGGQVEKPPLTWGNNDTPGQLAHTLKAGQVDESEQISPLVCGACDKPGDVQIIRGEPLHLRCRPAGWLDAEEIAP